MATRDLRRGVNLGSLGLGGFMMTHYDCRLNLLAGFAVGMLCTLLLRDWASINTNEVLAFIGALVGVAGAIYGAVEVENIKRRRQDTETLDIIRAALNELEFAWDTRNSLILEPVPAGDVAIHEVLIRCMTYLDAARSLDFAVKMVNVRDVNTWNALTRLQRTVAVIVPELEQACDLADFSDTPGFYAAFERRVANHHSLVRTMVQATRGLLKL